MQRGWLVAGAIIAATGSSEAAEVDLFGIHTPNLGKWAVYARVTGVSSPSTLASVSINVLNTASPGNGTSTVTSSGVMLPYGQSIYSDSGKFPDNPAVGYGFWFLRQNGTIGGDGARDITASQWTTYDSTDPIPYRDLILPNVGLAAGSAFKNDTTGGNFKTSAGYWSQPVLVASGNYTPAGLGGASAGVGLTLAYKDPSSSANILRWLPASNDYSIEPEPVLKVMDARNYTLGASNSGTTTVWARQGDADLDGIVNFNDLLALAKNYNRQDAAWFQGDFDYNGVVNFDDLLSLAKNYNAPAPASSDFESSFSAAVTAAFAAVPEPTSVGFIATALFGGLVRRRKRL